MTLRLSRSLALVVVALALVGVPASAAYAQERPRTQEDLAARTSAEVALPLPVTGLVLGEPPRIPYVSAPDADFRGATWELLRPDGSSLTLPRVTWSSWAAMGDGAIGMAATEAGPELQQVSADGEVRSRLVQHFGLAVSPDDEIVGWLGDHGSPHLVEGDGSRSLTLPRVPGVDSIGALWGATTCQEQAPEGGGCTVFVNGAGLSEASTSHGIVGRAERLVRVTDVSAGGRIAGRLAGREGCWGVIGADGHRRFRTCHYFLDSFSPDGHRVLGERSQARRLTARQFAVLGRDGHVVQAWTFDARGHRSLSQLTWEDDQHLLGVLHAGCRWSIVRIGTDGTFEYAVAPVTVADDEFTPFSLPLR